MEDKIYISGHRNPDSDSIISAIAYAEFKKRKGLKAYACRLGDMNIESTWLLNRFKFESPLLLEDARSTLSEIELDAPLTLSPDATIYEALGVMTQHQMQSCGVSNEQQQLMGMITKSDLSRIGLGDTAMAIHLLQNTPINNIVKTIKGKLIYEAIKPHYNGKVSIVALAENKLQNYDVHDRIVIIGNDQKAQIEAITKGAAILIVVWADIIDQSVIDNAIKYNCSIIISGHGTMNTSRYLFFSPPLKLIMQKELVSFHEHEFVEDAGRKMLKTRYSTYPVINEKNVLVGYVARFHILNARNRKIILVDHNEYSQSLKGIEDAELLEVVDHHRISDISTHRPIAFRNEIIGSTTSIIASMYLENQMDIPKPLAGLMLGAILSDTLKFKSPTTTEKDVALASVLAKKAGLDIDDFAKEMFKVTSSISGRDIKELITHDCKKFEIGQYKVSVSQVVLYDLSEVEDRIKDIEAVMHQYCNDKDLNCFLTVFTSILENGSIIYDAGSLHESIIEAFPNKDHETHSFQEDVLSRKHQIIPQLTRTLLNKLS